ncbi:hypothetical protein J2T32_003256 [Kerstersia gyiorum]|nr:hypothetical protein [Kerstersia gyiorum]MCP1638140.1 hypothetical protein [Kerstersia gyiorum]MCP1672730.1 hypothetical protein [Kerstersia gyiorum]MCP1680644.1 hypothetical protein [Kerstersia gyiorum]MCP1683919.1 hypothetical protein [Kerstersia gyiorum]
MLSSRHGNAQAQVQACTALGCGNPVIKPEDPDLLPIPCEQKASWVKSYVNFINNLVGQN